MENNPDNFRLRLSTLHDDWLNTCKNLDEQQRACELLHEEVKALSNRLNEARQQYTQAVETKEAMQERLQAKRDELSRLFNNTTPEKEEELLSAEIAAARQKESLARGVNEQASGRLRQLQGTQQNLLQTRMTRQGELSQRMADLDVWIVKFNSTHSPMQFAELEKSSRSIVTGNNCATASTRRESSSRLPARASKRLAKPSWHCAVSQISPLARATRCAKV